MARGNCMARGKGVGCGHGGWATGSEAIDRAGVPAAGARVLQVDGHAAAVGSVRRGPGQAVRGAGSAVARDAKVGE